MHLISAPVQEFLFSWPNQLVANIMHFTPMVDGDWSFECSAANVPNVSILLKNSVFGKIGEIFVRSAPPTFRGEGVRPNWPSAAHMAAHCALSQFSSDFSVSRVLSEKSQRLKFGVFQQNLSKPRDCCTMAKVGFADPCKTSEEPPYPRRVVLECDAVLIFEPRLLGKRGGNQHCYSSQSDCHCPRRC